MWKINSQFLVAKTLRLPCRLGYEQETKIDDMLLSMGFPDLDLFFLLSFEE
jgi:hypothetical protein